MSNGIQVIENYLNTMVASRSPYSVGKPTRLGRDFKNGKSEAPEKFAQSSLFGFVPVFDKEGAVYIYIRMGGGPEYINKIHATSVLGTSIENVPEADSMTDFYGSAADKYNEKIDTIDGTDTLIYHPQFGGRERDFLQHNVLDDKSRWTELQIAQLYPFRLEPQGESLVLSFAKEGQSVYTPISNNTELLAAFIVELLTSAIVSIQNTIPNSTADIESILNLVWQKENGEDLKSLVNTLFSRLAKEFLAAAENNVLVYFDGSDVGGFDENAYDHLYYYVFAQLLGYGEDLDTENVKAIFAKMDSTPEAISRLPEGFNYENLSNTLKVKFSQFVSVNSLDEVSSIKFKDANKSNSALTAQNKLLKAQNAKLVDPKKYRNVGMVAGFISAYLAVEQNSAKDMDLWKKALIVAGGTGLGAIPYVNFVSIASMPYLVNKGIELSGDDEFKASARARLSQAREGAGRLATSAREGAGRLAVSARERLAQARSAGELPEPSEA